MVWNSLYQLRQSEDALALPLGWYKEQAEQFSWVHSVDIATSTRLTSEAALGFVIRQPGPEFPNICDNFKILLASDNDPKTDRIVSIKELMHCCENDVEFRVDTAEKLDELFNTFYAHPTSNSEEAYILSEPIAFWKGVALLTTEEHRAAIKEELNNEPTKLAYWSDELRVPSYIVTALVGPRYEEEISSLLS